MTGERLQKVLARAGLGSRRVCEQLIAEGRVRVNGRRAELGQRVDVASDTVELDGVRVELGAELVYVALHKPEGVVTTASDPQRRRTVLELVPPEPRVFPVGRLDYDSSGLLLLTNDGDFANRVAHPRYEVSKTYIVEVTGNVGPKHMSKLHAGVELDDGMARVDTAELLDKKGGLSLIEVVLHEGRNRIVRRIFDELGFPVRKLARTAIGPVQLGRLKAGGWRHLDRREVLALLQAAELTETGHDGN